jgi:hypothetical protein
MAEEEYDDKIAEDPDDQVEDDEMSPAEAGFSRGAEAAAEEEKKKKEEGEEESEEIK